jgi:hypothetical protein
MYRSANLFKIWRNTADIDSIATRSPPQSDQNPTNSGMIVGRKTAEKYDVTIESALEVLIVWWLMLSNFHHFLEMANTITGFRCGTC